MTEIWKRRSVIFYLYCHGESPYPEPHRGKLQDPDPYNAESTQLALVPILLLLFNVLRISLVSEGPGPGELESDLPSDQFS
jgi:hypothetical protein